MFAIVPVNYLNVENQEFNQSEGYLVNSNETNFGLEFLDFLASLLLRGDSFSSRKKNGKMKILAQFGIFIRIIILNIGGKKANTQY